MTRSVEELRRRIRAEPRGACRDGRSVEGADIRYRSRHPPQSVAAAHQIRSLRLRQPKGPELGRCLKQQAIENPMQTIAAGTAVAVPVLRLARGSSLPLLMIGAGLALTSKTVRDRAADAVAPVTDKAREMMKTQQSARKPSRAMCERRLTRLKARPPAWPMMRKYAARGGRRYRNQAAQAATPSAIN